MPRANKQSKNDFEIPVAHRIHFSFEDARLKRTDDSDELFSEPQDVDRIFETDLPQSKNKNSITLYFHGGLVPSKKFYTSDELKLLYDELSKDSYPIFIIWETGGVETARSVFEDLKDRLDKIAKEHVVFQRVLNNLENNLSKKKRNAQSRQRDFGALPADASGWFESEKIKQPFLTEGDKQALIRDLENDDILNRELQAIAERERVRDTQNPIGDMGVNWGSPQLRPEDILAEDVVKDIASDLNWSRPHSVPEDAVAGDVVRDIASDLYTDGAMEVHSLRGKFQKFYEKVGQILELISERFANGHHHGVRGTIIEEMLWMLFLPRELGKLGWDQMKHNAKKAYASNKPGDRCPHGGSYLLKKLNEYLKQPGNENVQVNLIGHSAGSIHICHLVQAADKLIDAPNFQFANVILLAPGCDFTLFRKSIVNHRNRIRNFRLFALAEKYETSDPLPNKKVPVYPNSLLYFVSGVLEKDRNHDKPLLGLQRHLGLGKFLEEYDGLYDAKKDVIAVREFVKTFGLPVYAVGKSPDGLRSNATGHGEFDNDRSTAESVGSIIQSQPKRVRARTRSRTIKKVNTRAAKKK
jgi:hypothetical protein